MLETLTAIATLAIFAAFVRELRLRRRAQVALADAHRTNGYLERANATLSETLAARRIAREVSEVSEDEVVSHLERNVSVIDFGGIPVYSWSLASPYPTLAEAVRHVPKDQ